MLISCFSAPPYLESELREQVVEKGDSFKVKIPYSGTGPFQFRLKRDNRGIPDDHDRIKLVQFDGYVILQIKG